MKVVFPNSNGRLQEKAIQADGLLSHFSGLVLITCIALSLILSGCADKSDGPVMHTGTHNIATQKFIVNSSEGEAIRAEFGAIFAIPAGAFMDSMGNTISGPVELHVKEANRDIDILAGGLITQTGDDMLASGGMYKIAAFQDGKPLVLNPQVGIYAYLPTDQKDPDMGLYKGEFNEDKLNWKLTGDGEQGIPNCDRDKFTRKQCRKCKRLLKSAKYIKTGKKPGDNEYWEKRHYWQNGVLYFHSSGSSKPIMSKKQIEECEEWLKQSEQGRDLLAAVQDLQEKWKDEIGNYYSYKLNALGWYNIDKLVKSDIIAFSGKVVDENGQAVPDAKVHLYCKDPDLKVHIQDVAEDGNFDLKFIPGRQFMLYAYEKGKVGKVEIKLEEGQAAVGDVAIAQMDPEKVDQYLEGLM